ncbi:transcription factor ap-1 [Anaeramoeba flamelloides]|uniref:Transcription factor ap-1 n=1 Tax=Anaeramoeba flamelloides TaxID=1746091 RepID=A0AAV7ZWK7_9EUKA|nr:transcription factor ap-1 [Anaeramoeba flamelloides]
MKKNSDKNQNFISEFVSNPLFTFISDGKNELFQQETLLAFANKQKLQNLGSNKTKERDYLTNLFLPDLGSFENNSFRSRYYQETKNKDQIEGKKVDQVKQNENIFSNSNTKTETNTNTNRNTNTNSNISTNINPNPNTNTKTNSNSESKDNDLANTAQPRRILTRSRRKFLKDQGKVVNELDVSLDFSDQSFGFFERKRKPKITENDPVFEKTKTTVRAEQLESEENDPNSFTTNWSLKKKKKRKKKDWLKMGVKLTNEEKRRWKKVFGKKYRVLTESQKRERKRLRDRISARFSRQKKKEYIQNLENQMKKLQNEKSGVNQRLLDLENENKKFKEQIGLLKQLAFSGSIISLSQLNQFQLNNRTNHFNFTIEKQEQEQELQETEKQQFEIQKYSNKQSLFY